MSGYVVPHGQSYASPTLTGDHDWVHLKARYNYESTAHGIVVGGYSPVDWFSAGYVVQRTRAYQTSLDVQARTVGGFSHNKIQFTTQIFNFGWTDPTVVLSLGYSF